MSGSRTLRILSRAEGISLLGLLFVAMPLKYALDVPVAVRIVGSVHGVLFLALLSVGVQVVLEKVLPVKRVLPVLGWSFVPFGFLVVDRQLRDLR